MHFTITNWLKEKSLFSHFWYTNLGHIQKNWTTATLLSSATATSILDLLLKNFLKGERYTVTLLRNIAGWWKLGFNRTLIRGNVKVEQADESMDWGSGCLRKKKMKKKEKKKWTGIPRWELVWRRNGLGERHLWSILKIGVARVWGWQLFKAINIRVWTAWKVLSMDRTGPNSDCPISAQQFSKPVRRCPIGPGLCPI